MTKHQLSLFNFYIKAVLLIFLHVSQLLSFPLLSVDIMHILIAVFCQINQVNNELDANRKGISKIIFHQDEGGWVLLDSAIPVRIH